MTNLTEKEKIQIIFNKFSGTIENHTKYTIGHTPIFKQKVIEKYKTAEQINIALMTLNNLPDKQYYTDGDFFKIVDYNLKFKSKFIERIERMNLDNNITFKYAPTELKYPDGASKLHPEAPYQINIFVNGSEIGSFNFILLNLNKHKNLVINLIQGKKNLDLKKLKIINKTLGNWKQKIVENLVSISKSLKAETIGVLPYKYKSTNTSNEEYLRIINSYLEAFIHGGINPTQISFEKVDYKLEHKIRSKLEEILTKKIKRNKINKKIKEPLWKKHINKHVKH